MEHGHWRGIMTVGLLVLCATGSVNAQTHPSQRIHGRVTDAATGLPVPGTLVRVCVFRGVTTAHSAAAPPECDGHIQELTDSLGRFDFTSLTVGPHEVAATHPGYRPLTVTLEVPDNIALGLALQLAPISLSALHARSMPSPIGSVPGGLRADLLSHGTSDIAYSPSIAQDALVHFITPTSTGSAAMPVGGDVLRMLRNDAGVDAADDFTTRLWVRGGDWPETRVYFDGVPLFDPVHAAGVLAALRLPAGGMAVLHGGMQPVRRAGAAAAVLDLATASAARTGIIAEASPDAWAVSASGRTGAVGASLGVRAVSLATLSERTLRLANDTTAEFPFTARDLTARGDVQLSTRLRLEASAHGAAGEVTAREPPLSGAVANTRSITARVALVHTTPHLNTSLQFGVSDYTGRIDWPGGALPDTAEPTWAPPPTPQLVQRRRLQQLTAELSGIDTWSWSAGAALSVDEIDYDGPVPLPAVLGADHSRGSTLYRTAGLRGAAWFSGALPLSARVRAGVGVRGTMDRNAGVGLEPRASIRWQPRSVLSLELTAARHDQYEQSLGWAGAQVGPRLESTLLMMPAGGAIPVVRAMLLAAALDLQASERTSLRARLYRRAVSRHIMRSPLAGPISVSTPASVDSLAEGWSRAAGAAAGLELTATHESAHHAVAVAYTLARSRLAADGVRFYTPADRRHSLDASLHVRPLRPLQLGLRVAAGTGTPFTRFFADGCEPDCSERVGTVGPAGEARTPGYGRLDATASFETGAGPVRIMVGAGIVNALGRENALIYTGTRDDTDQFARGWPRSLSLFLRASL